ncbi:MAG: FliI/YscN family ATPase [Nitrospinae bacterium]|nr:FliI/YscN family ATPase [Nitrospinota bacterium]
METQEVASPLNFEKYGILVDELDPIKINGEVTSVTGLMVESSGPLTPVGSVCTISPKEGRGKEVEAEVVGIKNDKVLLMPLSESIGIQKGMIVKVKSILPMVNLSENLLGRVINGNSEFLDEGNYVPSAEMEIPLYKDPLNPLERGLITDPLDVGVGSINSLFTIGKGQRMGIMAGSGVGKSVLLGMMAKNTTADVNVIALIGERGREVMEFINDNLSEESRKKSIIVVATSDQPALVRIRATYLAITIAEYFRDTGKDVLLMMDSITRYAMSQREVGLFLGEPPTTKGYTPSVFSTIPKILERVGNVKGKGSITGIFTVLIEGDDINDPIGDAVRSVVDGHIFLSRSIAAKGLYPSIDILNSISRSMVAIVPPEHQKWAMQLKELVSVYQDSEDLINIGAYVKGTNPKIDRAIQMHDKIENFLRQGMNESRSFETSKNQLAELMNS